MTRSPRAIRTLLLLSLILLVGRPTIGWSKEESKIQIRLTDATDCVSGDARGRRGPRADLRSFLQGSRAMLQLRARGLDSETEYVLLAETEQDDPEPAELLRFTTKSNGTTNVKHDLTESSGPEAPTDPRGKLLVVAEAATPDAEVLCGWLYGDPMNDAPKTKIKELTELSADPDATPSGRVEARYDQRPNGHGSLRISTRGIPQDDYEVWVGGVFAAAFSPNPGGHANIDFQTRPLKGNSARSRPHRKKAQLDFDPRRQEIVVQLGDGTPVFSGPMLAQIDGLNRCDETLREVPLTGPMGSGSAALETESSCETILDVEIMDVPAGFYDLSVDGMKVATFEALDDMGSVFGFVRFDPTPDEADETELDFPVGSGSVVEVFTADADPAIAEPVLAGTLP